jgi:hypothetical protein
MSAASDTADSNSFSNILTDSQNNLNCLSLQCGADLQKRGEKSRAAVHYMRILSQVLNEGLVTRKRQQPEVRNADVYPDLVATPTLLYQVPSVPAIP